METLTVTSQPRWLCYTPSFQPLCARPHCCEDPKYLSCASCRDRTHDSSFDDIKLHCHCVQLYIYRRGPGWTVPVSLGRLISSSTNPYLQDLKEAVLQIYNNRSNLANTLKDTRTIVGKLERLLGICLQLIFIFFYLAIFNVCLIHPTCHALHEAETSFPASCGMRLISCESQQYTLEVHHRYCGYQRQEKRTLFLHNANCR